MTRGVLIFAQNNAEIDYAKISLFAAKRVKEFLNVPVSIVTDSKDWLLNSQPDAETVFDQIIPIFNDTTQTRKFYDGSLASKRLTWKNLSRSDCYDLTPYDETLVIDSDYIISSDNLNKIWGSNYEFLIYKNSYDLSQWRDDSCFRYFNQYAIPFYWATAFYFKKTAAVESFFTLVKYVKDNWSYFRALYFIDSSTFRNDYAFSIAIHIMNNGLDNDFAKPLPGSMIYALDRDILIELKNKEMKLLVEKENYTGEYTLLKTSNVDVHVMNKFSLSRVIDNE